MIMILVESFFEVKAYLRHKYLVNVKLNNMKEANEKVKKHELIRQINLKEAMEDAKRDDEIKIDFSRPIKQVGRPKDVDKADAEVILIENSQISAALDEGDIGKDQKLDFEDNEPIQARPLTP